MIHISYIALLRLLILRIMETCKKLLSEIPVQGENFKFRH